MSDELQSLSEVLNTANSVPEPAVVVKKVMGANNKMVLAEGGKYMRHMPSGRIYIWEENGAKRDDVEAFIYHKKGSTAIKKPPKTARPGPFQRERAVGFDNPSDNVQIVAG